MGSVLMHKVYIATGKVAHVLDTNAPVLPGTVRERFPALCHMRPLWPGAWLGGDGDEFTDSLPLCRTCETLMGAMDARPA